MNGPYEQFLAFTGLADEHAGIGGSKLDIGATFDNTQISQVPTNGCKWGGLMTLTREPSIPGRTMARACRSWGQASIQRAGDLRATPAL